MNFDARIGKNSIFWLYSSNRSWIQSSIFNSIVLTDQFIELNENRTVDCKRSMLVNNNSGRLILSLKTNDPEKTVLYDD